MRFGKFILCAIDKGATGSGGETKAPKTKPTGHEKPSSQRLTAATTTVVNTTQPIASSDIGRKLNLNSRQLMATADE
jgi:hypothetical protein